MAAVTISTATAVSTVAATSVRGAASISTAAAFTSTALVTSVSGTASVSAVAAVTSTAAVTTVYVYQAAVGNMLPFDPATGGLAGLAGWLNPDGSVHPGSGNLTLTLAEDTGIATALVTSGTAVSPLKVMPGLSYLAAVTCSGLAVISLRWIFNDGTVSAEINGAGEYRAVVSAVAPANAVAVLVEIFAPTANVIASTAITETVSYWDVAGIPPSGFAADINPPAPVVLSGVVLYQGSVDPGPMPPTIVDTTIGQRIWNSLPEVYTTVDATTGLPLNKYLHGLFSQADAVESQRAAIATGSLTNPALVSDANIPWLAQMMGVGTTRPLSLLRQHMISKNADPAVGSRGRLKALGQTFLVGTKTCDVFPNPVNRWQLVFRVRSDELTLVTDAAGFTAAMIATGQIPAGFLVLTVTGLPLWSAIDALGPTWAGIDVNQTWATLDALGVGGI